MTDEKSITPEVTAEAPPVGNRPGTLFVKLARVMSQIERIPKNGYNANQKYKFANEGDISDTIRGLLAEERVAFLARMLSVVRTETGALTGSGAKWFHYLARFEYTFACGDTGQMWTSNWEGEALEWSDKGISKAATAALKYFLMKTFMISTGDLEEDPDNDNPEPTQQKSKTDKTNQRQQQQKPPQQQQAGQGTPPTWATAANLKQLRAKMESEGVVWAEIPSLIAAIPNPEDLGAWGKRFPKGADAATAIRAAFATRQQNSGPAKPKNGGKPDHQWTEAEVSEMDILASLWYDTSMDLPMDAETMLKGMDGKIAWSEFKDGPQQAKAALKAYAITQNLPIIAHVAQFQNQYTVFSNGQLSARLYGRDALRELSDNWLNYADSWEKGKKYDLLKDDFMLIVSWIDKDGKYLEVVDVDMFEQVDFEKDETVES